jgi:hypothetical protein
MCLHAHTRQLSAAAAAAADVIHDEFRSENFPLSVVFTLLLLTLMRHVHAVTFCSLCVKIVIVAD